MLYAPFNGRAGSEYTSLAKSGGNRPGNFNETETIVVVVALFIRIRTTILVVCVCVCVCVESVRGSLRERIVRGGEDIIITRVFLHKKTMM